MTASWWSQTVSAEGSTASEGIRRQLGKPNLDPLTVLIRETAQNTCDAALPGDADIDYSVQLHQLSGRRLDAWAEYLLPEPTASSLGLEAAMRRAHMLLTISDRGTTGLGGPLRADEVPEDGERPDFVNFMRNVGEPKGMSLGGGSYGFGKGILYNVSRCHVVVADSVCLYRGRRQRRLIGAALGDGYRHDGRPYTGRHWLGPIQDGFARPLIDDEAEEMAARLGLPKFEDNATGTTVVIVDADLGRQTGPSGEQPRTAEDAARYLVSTMLWNLWPRMLRDHRNRLVCRMRRDGFPTAVPDPESIPELRPYADAYREVIGGTYEVPRRGQAPREIGRFAIARAMAPAHRDELISAAAPYEGRAHHCARMRQADLVVDYQIGEPTTDEAVQYGAVFRASAEADQYFAEAEPPTHDDWVLSGLKGTSRGVVQLANSFIRDRIRMQEPVDSAAAETDSTPLGFLSGRLSGLMAGMDGGAATATSRERPTPMGRRRAIANPRIVDGPKLEVVGDDVVVAAVIELPEWASTRTVIAEPLVVVGGGGVEEPGTSNDNPEVLGWSALEDDSFVPGDSLTAPRDAPRGWRVTVRPAADTVLRLRIRALSEGEG